MAVTGLSRAVFPTVGLVALLAALAFGRGGAEAPATAAEPAATATPAPIAGATPIAFGAESYAWTWDATAATLTPRVEIFNLGRRALDDVVFAVALHGVVDASDDTRFYEGSRLIRIAAIAGPIPPGGAERRMVKVLPDTPKLKGGSYKGWLTATAGTAVARVPVTLSVEAAPWAPAPLTEKQTLQAIRWIPFTKAHIRHPWVALSKDVPAAVTAKELKLKKDAPLGGLQAPEEGAVPVRSAGATSPLPGGVAGAKIAADGVGRPGSYAGTIHLLGDDKTGDVELTIVSKDTILWPIALLILGIELALFARRYRGVRRPVEMWRRSLARLERRYHRTHDRFVAAAKDEPWVHYNADASVRQTVASVNATLDGVLHHSLDKIPAAKRKAVRDGLKKLRDVIAAFGTLDGAARTLAERREAMVEARPVSGFDPPVPGHQPAINVAIGELLQGSEMTVDTMPVRLKTIETASTQIADWPRLRDAVQSEVDWFNNLKGEPGSETVAAYGRLRGAWCRAWTAPELEDAVADTARAELLQRIHAMQDLHGAAPRTRRAAHRRTLGMEQSAIATADPGGGSALLGLAPFLADRRVQVALLCVVAVVLAVVPGALLGGAVGVAIGLAIVVGAALLAFAVRKALDVWRDSDDPVRRGDLLVKLLAWVVALSTGLTALYIDKTFGTWDDYVAALLWGLTTATAIDALADAVRLRAESR